MDLHHFCHYQQQSVVLFGSRPRLKAQSDLNISCEGTSIEAKDNVKYLGAVLDQCLSGENMVTSIIQRPTQD